MARIGISYHLRDLRDGPVRLHIRCNNHKLTNYESSRPQYGQELSFVVIYLFNRAKLVTPGTGHIQNTDLPAFFLLAEVYLCSSFEGEGFSNALRCKTARGHGPAVMDLINCLRDSFFSILFFLSCFMYIYAFQLECSFGIGEIPTEVNKAKLKVWILCYGRTPGSSRSRGLVLVVCDSTIRLFGFPVSCQALWQSVSLSLERDSHCHFQYG